jgi:hypothetical protein
MLISFLGLESLQGFGYIKLNGGVNQLNTHELNNTIVQLIGNPIDKPLSSAEIEYAPETYKFVIEKLKKNFLHIDNKTLESMLRANAKMLMVICYEIIQTTALEKKVNDIINNHTIEKQEVIPILQADKAYEIKAFELAKMMINAINKLLDLPVSGRLEDLYTPEIDEPKIEQLKRNLICEGKYKRKRKKMDS